MKKSISASEINEFNYCPYSWLYSRTYGKSHMSKTTKKRLDKGALFHQKHQKKELAAATSRNRVIPVFLITLIAILCAVLLYLFV